MFSQHKEAPISVAHFQIVEDDRYIHFPWGKVTFEKSMSSWQQDFNTMKQLYSLGGMPHVSNVWMFEYCSENIQPTTDEVSRLDLSFLKDFEICDPITYALTSDSRKLKRTAIELQQRVGTIAEEFGDFSTIPPQKILIKAGFESPVSPDQPLKKRNIVMFKQDNQVVMDNDSSGCGHAVHHGSDLYREIHKDATDKGEIDKFAEKMAELVTLISKIPAEIVKALKNEENKQSQEDKIDEQQQSQEDGFNKKERQHKSDMKNVNAADKEAGREDNFKNEDCSDLQALEDVNLTAKEDVTEVKLKNQESTDVTDVQDAVDFDKKEKLKYTFDGYTINQDLPNELMIDYSQWIVVGLLKTHSVKKETENRYRVNASGLGYRQLDFVVAYPQSKNWFYLMSECKTCWNDEHLDVIFYHLRKKSKIQLCDNYRYTTTSCFFKTYVEKTHTRYYPAELVVDLSTQQDYAESIVVAKNEDAIANIIQGFCMPAGLPWYMVDEVYVLINCGKEFHWVLAVIVLKERLIRVYDSLSSKRKEEPLIEIQKLAVILPTYLSDNGFYDKTERTDWPSLKAYKGKINQQTGLINKIPFDVDYVQNIPQQAYDSLDCGVFVCAYAEILSKGLQVHSCGFDAASQRARYPSLLWHYGVKKANEGYTSDNGDPPRLRKSVIEEIEANAIVTLE
ncbi:hypothetical protein BC332_07229 [Capsicum chinense]|nr:hypothetical protein BC332_07229 [Capsicum chinense]